MLIKQMSFVNKRNYWFAQGSSKCPKEDVLDSWNESSSSSEFLSNYRDEQLKIILQLSSDSISTWTSSLVLRCIKVLATSQFTAGNWTGSRQDILMIMLDYRTELFFNGGTDWHCLWEPSVLKTQECVCDIVQRHFLQPFMTWKPKAGLETALKVVGEATGKLHLHLLHYFV